MDYKKDVAPDNGGEENQDEDDGKGGNHGNTGLPFGLCAKYGISLPEDATPRDAWNALKQRKGIDPPWKDEDGKDKSDDKDEDETQPKEQSEEEKFVISSLERYGVEKQEVKKGKKLSSEDIVEKIAGGDLTDGSCASLCLAYIANTLGYDVTDYRGGKSQKAFSSWIKRLALAPKVESRVVKGYSDINAAYELLRKMETGKEYMLITGRHAAMVRKQGDGFEYLELQSGKEGGNGWKELNQLVLSWRFGARKRGKYEFSTILSEASKFSNIDLPRICAYLQTATDKQEKGDRGSEK